MNTVGGGHDKGGKNKGAGLRINTFLPYTGDSSGMVLASNMATANEAVSNSPGRNRINKGNSHHLPNPSTSTFSNVSLSQSVICEISERTGGALEDSVGGTNDAVKALWRDGVESARQKHASQESPERRTNNITVVNKSKGIAQIKEVSGDYSPSRKTHTTAKSTVRSKCKNFPEDIQTSYTRFKTTRNHGQKENKNSILQSIIEDVQFCGLYSCGIDTNPDNNN